MRVVVVGEEGGVPLAQFKAASGTGRVKMVMLVVVGRLEVDGAHVVLLEMLPQALFSRLTLSVYEGRKESIKRREFQWPLEHFEESTYYAPGNCFPLPGCYGNPDWIR